MADGRENNPSPLPAAGATGAGGGGGTPCHLPLIIITVAAEPGGEGGKAARGWGEVWSGEAKSCYSTFTKIMKSTPLPPRTRAALPAPTGVPRPPPKRRSPRSPGGCQGKTGNGERGGRGSPKPERAAQKRASPRSLRRAAPGRRGGAPGTGRGGAVPGERPGARQLPARWTPRSPQPQAGQPGSGRPNFPAGGARGTWLLPVPSLHRGGWGVRGWGRDTPKNRGREGAQRRGGEGRRCSGVPAHAAATARVSGEGGPRPAAEPSRDKSAREAGRELLGGMVSQGVGCRNLAKLRTSQFRCLFPQLL